MTAVPLLFASDEVVAGRFFPFFFARVRGIGSCAHQEVQGSECIAVARLLANDDVYCIDRSIRGTFWCVFTSCDMQPQLSTSSIHKRWISRVLHNALARPGLIVLHLFGRRRKQDRTKEVITQVDYGGRQNP